MKNKTNLLEEISQDLEQIDLTEVKGPRSKIESGDTVVGTMDEHLKRLWQYRENMGQRIQSASAEYKVRCREKEKFADELLWASIRHAFPEIKSRAQIRLVKNWHIIQCAEREEVPKLAIELPYFF